MKLVFATGNSHKVKEVRKLLPASVELLSLSDLDFTDDLPETANTFEGNALQKARYIYDKLGVNCIADDSGIEVFVLGGRPGVFSARYAGPDCNSHDNVKKLLTEMKGETNRKARFRTIIASIIDGEEKTFEGIVNGEITTDIRGMEGFGYDPVFIPEGYNNTFAEMSPEQKNMISHRAMAIQKLTLYLKQLIKTETP